MNKNIFLIYFLLILPFSLLAAEHPASEAGLTAYKELNQARTDALKESLQKDIQAQSAHVEAQDKRIDRQDKLLDSFSARIGDLSIFLTVFGLVAGLLGYFTVSSRAKNEARLAAAEWMEEEGQKAIGIKIMELDSHIAAQKKAVTEKREEFDSELEKLRANAAAPLAEIQRLMSASQKSMGSSVQEQISQTNSDAISQLVEALKRKPEAEYGFDDWYVRAHDAYTKGSLALAAEYWLQAARGGKGSGVQVAQSLYNAGIALSNLSRNDEAIAVYDEVVSRYGNAPEAALREQVAKALANKSANLGRLNRRDEAIAVCDEVVSRYGNEPGSAFREEVGRALVNKGIALGQLNRLDETIAVCDEVVARYGNAPEVALRDRVTEALNTKGFTLLCRAKANWDNEAARLGDLQAATTLFAQAEKDIGNKPFLWGNQAYASFLFGQPVAARPLLRQALQQGGEELYKATLGDLDIHTSPPDAEFRALLEELWAEVKSKS